MAWCTYEMDMFFILFVQWDWWCIVIFTPQNSVIMDVTVPPLRVFTIPGMKLKAVVFSPEILSPGSLLLAFG